MTIRVGLLSSEFPPDLGGVETYAWQLARALSRRPGLQVTVYAPPLSASVDPPPGVALKPWLQSCAGLDWQQLKDEPIDVWHALSACHAWIAEKHRATVVSVHGNDFLAPYPLTARPAMRLPGLWQLRGWTWRRLRPLWVRATRRMLARALPRATAILANSRYTADVLRARLPRCAPLISVAGVGVDSRYFAVERTPRNGAARLLTVCRLSEPRKNVDRVLQALAALKDRFDFEYTIAGDGPLRPALEQLASRLGIAGRTRFLGRVSDAELYALYGRAELFVLAASVTEDSHEGFGIVYLEAAASGVPSLAARLAGAAEAVAERQSGYFVDSPDVESLRVALARFLDGSIRFDPETCRGFAREFDWERVADACERMYRRSLTRAAAA